MSDYRVHKQSEGFWQIYDCKGDAAYLIEGETRALLMDTACIDEPLMPLIRTLTDKPVALALTHAHIDHMYRCEEFETVYLHEKDMEDWHKGLGRVMWLGAPLLKVSRKKYRVETFTPLHDDSEIDLGGFCVKCLRLSGHTRGSVMYIDECHKAVLVGDAAGPYLWLFLPFCTTVSTYKAELERVEKELQPYADYKYYAGHCGKAGEEPGPLGIRTFTDMRELCEKLLAGTADLQKVKQIPILPLLYAKNGISGMVLRKRKIK